MPENHIGVRLNPSLHGAFGMTLDEETIPTFNYIVELLIIITWLTCIYQSHLLM